MASNIVRFPLRRVFWRASKDSFARAMDMYAASTRREIKEEQDRKRQEAINAEPWEKVNFDELEKV